MDTDVFFIMGSKKQTTKTTNIDTFIMVICFGLSMRLFLSLFTVQLEMFLLLSIECGFSRHNLPRSPAIYGKHKHWRDNIQWLLFGNTDKLIMIAAPVIWWQCIRTLGLESCVWLFFLGFSDSKGFHLLAIPWYSRPLISNYELASVHGSE